MNTQGGRYFCNLLNVFSSRDGFLNYFNEFLSFMEILMDRKLAKCTYTAINGTLIESFACNNFITGMKFKIFILRDF